MGKGRGIVEFATAEDCATAIAACNGSELEGRVLEFDTWTTGYKASEQPGFVPKAKSGGKGSDSGSGGKGWGKDAGKSWDSGKGGGKGWDSGKGGKGKGKSKGPRDRSTTVWIGNIPDDITKDELEENFKAAGTIKMCRLTSKTKTGIIVYATEEEKQTAISMFNGSDVGGALLHVD